MVDIWERARAELSDPPVAGGCNMAALAVDRHVALGRGERAAFRFIGAAGTVRAFTFGDLARETDRFAAVLAALGVAPGERVFTLLGRVPDLAIAFLGALKAKAVASALFQAFGPEPIRVRLAKGRAAVLVTTAALYRRKVMASRCDLPQLRHVVLVDGEAEGARSLPALMAATPAVFQVPQTTADDPALLHFTSGTTGDPKGALHVHGAVAAHLATARTAFGLRPGDTYWCTADPGWVTGISYGLLAPLAAGATAVVDEGEFDAARWYGILSAHRVQVWYTAPTAIRRLIRAGDDLPRRFDLSALRHIASVGEPLDEGAVRWAEAVLDRPIHDTWWQTETGAIMIANTPDTGVRAGAMGQGLPGLALAVVRSGRQGPLVPVPAGEEGELAIGVGWPSQFRAYVEDENRYRACFRDGFYLTGDLVRRDADGWFWFLGRSDDAIKSAGHLIGPFEVERVLLAHEAVAEAAVIGLPDPVIGETVHAYVRLRPGFAGDETVCRTILAFARDRLGPAVAPREIVVRTSLPTTRSGKILRRLLRARELGLPEGDTSSLDPEDGAGHGVDGVSGHETGARSEQAAKPDGKDVP